jgi:hypothetical protein
MADQYDRLAAQMGALDAPIAPMPSHASTRPVTPMASHAPAAPAVDYDALARAAGALDVGDNGNTLGAGVRAFGEQIIPIDALKALWEIVQHPVRSAEELPQALMATPDVIKGIVGQNVRVFQEGQERYQRGDPVGGFAKTLYSLIPLLGPALAQQGDRLEQGRIAEGLGGTLGLGTALLGPAAIAEARGAVPVRAMAANPNAAEADAVAWAQRQGIPIDAATATGNKVVRAAQHVADRTLGGSFLAGADRAAQTQAEALAATGRGLAERAAPAAGPQTLETAGAALRQALGHRLRALHGQADTAYARLRDIETAPENVRSVAAAATEAAPDTFARTGASRLVAEPFDDLFDRVLADARKNGYTGRASALRTELEARVADAAQARSEALAEGFAYRPEELLRAIAERGGIGKDAGYPGEIAHLWESSSGIVVPKGTTKSGRLMRMRSLATGGFRGVTNVIRKSGGHPLDTMAELLRDDPRFEHITSPQVLLDDLYAAIGKGRPQGTVGPGDLAEVGVRPGARWWEADTDIAFDPATLENSPTGPTMALPVDLRAAKAALRPVLEQWDQTWPLTRRQASPAYQALSSMLAGPDDVPLSVAERNLGALKGAARSAGPARDVAHGLAAKGVGILQDAVDTTAQSAKVPAGQTVAPGAPLTAMEALTAGRSATSAKWGVADMVKALRKEPVQAARQIVQRGDAALEQLQTLQKTAPEVMPKLGRAVLEDLITRATAEGSFTRAARLWADWQNLGPKTKAVLFGHEPGLVRDLDRFFLVAKRIGDNPNPSGTGHVVSLATQGTGVIVAPVSSAAVQLTGAAVSKLLHSRRGVRLLTEGLTIPVTGPKSAAQAATLTELARLAGPGADAASERPSRIPIPAGMQ